MEYLLTRMQGDMILTTVLGTGMNLIGFKPISILTNIKTFLSSELS